MLRDLTAARAWLGREDRQLSPMARFDANLAAVFPLPPGEGGAQRRV